MIKGILLFVLGVALASGSQIMLKISANQYKGCASLLKQYVNPWVIGAYFVFFITTIISVFALKWIPVSLAAIIETLAQVFVPLLSYFFLKEAITIRKVIGIILIVFGLLIAFA